MSVHVRDTLSGERVEIGQSGRIGLYVCGPTVYNHIHIGNARAPLFWDVAVRYLKSRDYDVTYVQNITDVEDKIINKANEEGVSWEEIVRRYTDSFHERLEMLGVGLPDVEPRATEHIPEMISLIEELIEKGHAYAPSEANGDVYYDVESFPGYGKLSHQRPEEMRETEKGQTGFKKSPLDFALWKASKPGEPSWESPWGPGRPGWHIECSAMVEKHLPAGADMHGGGTDLLFPHHENELAQSCGAHPDHAFVRAWVHHGMVNFVGDKMAKSIGNVVDVAEAVERLMRLYRQISGSENSSALSDKLATELMERFDAAMRDDLNTPEAIAAVFEVIGRAGQEISPRPEATGQFSSLSEALREVLTIFGFDLAEELAADVDGVRVRYSEEPGESVLRLVAARELARRGKDWPVADRLRDELGDEGWAVEDTPEGPILTRR